MSGLRRIGRGLSIALAATFLAPAPLAARTGPTIRELVEVADIESLAASPDGRWLAFRVQRPSVGANSYRIDWYVADLQTKTVRRVADGGAPIYTNGLIESESPVWSPDSRFFYRRALVNEAIGIWRTSADGSGSRLVVGGASNVESLAAGRDGRSLSYVTGPTRAQIQTAERREYDDGILIDPSIDTYQNPFRGGWEKGRLASERLIGIWYARAGLLWRVPRLRHRLDLVTMREVGSEMVPSQRIDPLKPSHERPPLTVRSSSGWTATLAGGDSGQHLEAEDGHGNKALCDTGPCLGSNLTGLAWQPDGGGLLFAKQDHNYRQTLYFWNPRWATVRRLAGGDGQLSGGRSGSAPCAVAASTAVCVEAKPASPPRLVRISLANGRMSQLFDPNAQLRRRDAPRVEQMTYRLDDGRTATGTLLYRPGAMPAKAPLFVTYYICPGYLRGGMGDPFPLEPLVNSGFVVACLNVVPYKMWGDGPDRERAALASLSTLIRLLDQRGWIDPSKVAMGGFSAGSEATMWVAMNSKLLAAAAIVSPQYEPTSYWMSAMRGSDIPEVLKRFQQVGPPDQDPQRWKLISPALNTDRIKAPVLMQLAEQEFRASLELFSRLSNTNTPVEMYAFPDEAHIKIQPRHQFVVYRRNLDWFRYWLQGYVDPDPALAAQYRRWDALRQRRGESAK